jgi:hypothetical protein
MRRVNAARVRLIPFVVAQSIYDGSQHKQGKDEAP